MKFLDSAKIYVRSGNGGGAVSVFAAKNPSNLAALTAAMAAKAVMSGPWPMKTLTP